MKRVYVLISGGVIGVFFRKFVKDNADKLNVKGFVGNKGNEVECVFEGENKAVEELIKLCKKGPIESRVIDIKIEEEKYINEFKVFKITKTI